MKRVSWKILIPLLLIAAIPVYLLIRQETDESRVINERFDNLIKLIEKSPFNQTQDLDKASQFFVEGCSIQFIKGAPPMTGTRSLKAFAKDFLAQYSHVRFIIWYRSYEFGKDEQTASMKLQIRLKTKSYDEDSEFVNVDGEYLVNWVKINDIWYIKGAIKRY